MSASRLGADGYPVDRAVEVVGGRRVWRIESDGESDAVAEGHGEAAAEALRLALDDGFAAREGWAVFVERCDCDDESDDGECLGACPCGGQLPPCGEEWGWLVTECRVGAPGALAVSWPVAPGHRS